MSLFRNQNIYVIIKQIAVDLMILQLKSHVTWFWVRIVWQDWNRESDVFYNIFSNAEHTSSQYKTCKKIWHQGGFNKNIYYYDHEEQIDVSVVCTMIYM